MTTSVRRAVVAGALLLLAACALLPHSTKEPAVVDLNTASLGSIEKLPGITPSIGRQIVEGRPYGDLEELVERRILTHRELARLTDRVAVEPSAR